jgi:hypothetical protein
MTTEVAKADEPKVNGGRALIPIGPNGVELPDIDAMFRFARCYLQSGLAPASYKNEQQLVIAWARARELGIPYLQAVEGMSVINGRIGLMGDLALALAERSGELEDKRVRYTGEGDELTCFLELKRKGREWKQWSFSVKEARSAQIYDRSAVWRQYPRRMTYYRALGFALRDEFGDILRGMKTTEELQDYPEEATPRRKTRYDLHKPVRESVLANEEPSSAAKPEPVEQAPEVLKMAKAASADPEPLRPRPEQQQNAGPVERLREILRKEGLSEGKVMEVLTSPMVRLANPDAAKLEDVPKESLERVIEGIDELKLLSTQLS